MYAATSIFSELRALARLAAPIATAQAGLALMGLIDTAVVGHLGTGPLGAVGLANGLFFAIAVLGIGLVMGFDPLVSQAIGAGETQHARELLWQAFWLALLAAIALAIPVALAPQLLSIAGIDASLIADARAFLLLRLPGLLPTLVFVAQRGYLQSVGRVTPLVTVTVVANLCNLGLDILLVFGGAKFPAWTGPLRGIPALGAAGAGLATSLCNLIQVALLAIAVRGVPAAAPSRRPRWSILRQAFRVGFPSGLQLTAETGVFALVGILAGRLGPESIAAHQVALSIASFTFCAAVGVGNAGSVRVGWAIGAGNSAAARFSGLVAFAGSAACMAACGLLFWLMPRPIAALFSDRPEVLDAAVPLLAVAAAFQISDGVQAVGAGVLRGTGDTRFSFFVNLAGHYLIGLPIAMFLGFTCSRGVCGLWWGLSAGLTVVAVSLFARFWILSARPMVRLETAPNTNAIG